VTTARALITDALRTINVLASGESMPAPQALDALRTLNDLIASWELESLLVYTLVDRPLETVVGVADYLLGPGGAWAHPRPNGIERVWCTTSAGRDRLLEELEDGEYAAIADKSRQSATPEVWTYLPALPSGVLRVWPVPGGPSTLHLHVWEVLGSFATLDSDVPLAPGYPRALRWALAQELAPEYGQILSVAGENQAIESKRVVKAHNSRVPLLEIPDEFRYQHYHIYGE
jgi:hypothetical protein